MGRLGCDFVEKGVLAEETADGQVLFTLMGEVVSCDLLPQVIADIPGKHGLCRWRGFLLGANGALADVIDYICINARPAHCLSCLCLHLNYLLVHPMQASKGAVQYFLGNTNAGSLEETSFYGQLISGSPEVSGDPQDLLAAIWPTPYG